MAICGICQTDLPRPCSYTPRTKECYRALIVALRHVAKRCGYALAVHGSLRSDIDLLAVPWRDSAVSAAYLAEEIRKTAEQIIGTARSHSPQKAASPLPQDQPPPQRTRRRRSSPRTQAGRTGRGNESGSLHPFLDCDPPSIPHLINDRTRQPTGSVAAVAAKRSPQPSVAKQSSEGQPPQMQADLALGAAF